MYHLIVIITPKKIIVKTIVKNDINYIKNHTVPRKNKKANNETSLLAFGIIFFTI